MKQEILKEAIKAVLLEAKATEEDFKNFLNAGSHYKLKIDRLLSGSYPLAAISINGGELDLEFDEDYREAFEDLIHWGERTNVFVRSCWIRKGKMYIGVVYNGGNKFGNTKGVIQHTDLYACKELDRQVTMYYGGADKKLKNEGNFRA